MKKIAFMLLFLAGCSNLYLDTSDLLRTQNAENIKKLTTGMRKDVVLELMGTDPSKSLFMWIDNPTARKPSPAKTEKSMKSCITTPTLSNAMIKSPTMN